MLRKFSNLNTLHQRWVSTARPMVQIDEAVHKQLEDQIMNPKQHPGIIKSHAIQTPQWVEIGMTKAIADQSIKNLREEGNRLALHLAQRHPPPEASVINTKLKIVKEQFLQRIDESQLSAEQMEEFWKRNNVNVKMKLKEHVYAWSAMQYDKIKSLHYMVGRGAQDYAVLCQIFNEIATTDKNFKPKTLFDFGSGIGTVTWAASQFWRQSLTEYYCVDSSADMATVAETIINCHPSGIKRVYYRQFLPASAKIKSDMVVSAYSLFELPNVQSRLEVILNLWMKTQNYLIIVEQGTNAGFRLVNEARDFILDFASKSLETDDPNPVHVFAPCPHDLACPRYTTDCTPCNFETRFFTLQLGRSAEVNKERYSYVILKKGNRPTDDKQWPRIVRSTLNRSKHTVCRMCTAAGKLEEVVFTAAKHGKYTYKCARCSNWGNKLPLQIVHPPSADNPE